MTLHITAIAAFADNYIWVIGREGRNDVAVVDPRVDHGLSLHLQSLLC